MLESIALMRFDDVVVAYLTGKTTQNFISLEMKLRNPIQERSYRIILDPIERPEYRLSTTPGQIAGDLESGKILHHRVTRLVGKAVKTVKPFGELRSRNMTT